MAEPCEQNRTIEFFQKRLEEHDERLSAGDLLLQELKRTSHDTNITVKKIDKRLFVDNGTLSVQTKLDRLETFKKVSVWVLGLGGLTMASIIGALILNWMGV